MMVEIISREPAARESAARESADSAKRRYRPEETRERILAAAKLLFARKGYPNTSTADIAAEAGVAEGSIFYHFGSKRNLMTAIGEAFGAMLVAHMRGDCTDLSQLRIEEMLGRCFSCFEKNGGLEKQLGLSGSDPELQSMMSASRDVVLAFVTDHMQALLARFPNHSVDVPIAAALSYAAVHEAIDMCFRRELPFARERIVAETIRFIKVSCGPNGSTF
jgi:AcrR family transcriptional regulator